METPQLDPTRVITRLRDRLSVVEYELAQFGALADQLLAENTTLKERLAVIDLDSTKEE